MAAAAASCPAGFERHFDLDSNVEYCQSTTDPTQRAPLTGGTSAQTNLFALSGLTAAAIVAVAFLMVPQPRRRRRK